MYILLIIVTACVLLPTLNAIMQDARDRHERREAEQRRLAKAEEAAKAKNERALQRNAGSLAQPAEAVKDPECGSRKDPEPAGASKGTTPTPIVHGNNAFVGQVVAFTGTLPNMTRDEAIAAVTANGGRAYKTMPAGTTLLVVGDNKGKDTKKLDLADRWIGQVRKITPAQFDAMLKLPLTLTPDEFAAMIAAR